jgi:flavin-binding protein dodecin
VQFIPTAKAGGFLAPLEPRICKPSVAKVIELIGSSPSGWEDAAANAVKEAAKTVKNIRQVYLKECTAKVEGDRIVEYRANVKVTFIVEREG